jgi:hypothetical protein
LLPQVLRQHLISIIFPLPCLCKSEKSDRKVGKVGSCIIYRAQVPTTLGNCVGLLQDSYQNQTMLWLRWWDTEGNLLLTGAERASRTQQALFDNSSAVGNGIECRASGISPGFISRVRQAAFPILMQLNLAFPHKNCGFSI